MPDTRSPRRQPEAQQPRQSAKRHAEDRRSWALPAGLLGVADWAVSPPPGREAPRLPAGWTVPQAAFAEAPAPASAAPLAASREATRPDVVGSVPPSVALPGAAPLSADSGSPPGALGEAAPLDAGAAPALLARPACAFRIQGSGPRAPPPRGGPSGQGCRGCRTPRCRPGPGPRAPPRGSWRPTARRTTDTRYRGRSPSARGKRGRRSRNGRRSGISPSPERSRATVAAAPRRGLLVRRS